MKNEKLHQARIDRRWSAKEAAQRIGVSYATYVRWEQGTQTPYDTSLMDACKVFDLPPQSLGFGPEAPTPTVPGTQVQPIEAETLEEERDTLVVQEHTPPDNNALMPFPQIITQGILEDTGVLHPVPPDTATRLTAWGALLHVQGDEDVPQERVCELLEVEIIALALKWKWSSDPLAVLQQLTYESMRKHDTMQNNNSDHDTRLTRRRALQTIALLPIQMYGLTLFAPDMSNRLPVDELLPCCASGMIGLWELLQHAPEGMAAIGRMLPLYLSTLERVARQSPPPFQQAAARLAAQGYLLVTKLATHYRRLDQMEAASLLARSYGQMAHDPNLEVAALIRLAVKYSNERRMVEAFNTYQETAALPGFASASPLLRGNVYGALAATGAFCQHPEALSLLSQAKDLYPTKPEDDPSFVFTLDGMDTLSLWEGLTLKRTGHHVKAVTAFSRFGSLTPVPDLLDYRRAEHLNYAASVAVEQRELDTAYLYLDTAEEVAQNIQHKQRQAEVRETFRDMQLLWPHEPKVKTLQEKIYARQQ